MDGRRACWSLVAALGAWAASSCAPSAFPSATLVSSVRILASSADQPYAKPESTVKLTVLAVDGRPQSPAPMAVYWLPFVCENPPNDAYYACFQQFAQGSQSAAPDGGTARPVVPSLVTACGGAGPPPVGAGAAGAMLKPGVDLTPFLPAGDCAQFTMPADAVSAHSRGSAQVPYGMAIVFNVACAGHLELVPLDPNNVQAPPVGCFDAQHNRLGPNDYVIGFTRIYAYDALQNANPVIDHIDVEGQTVDLGLGFEVSHCSSGNTCANVHIGPVVPPSSQEVNPEEQDVNGKPIKEQVWADFFSTVGSFTNEARLLYDATTGSVGGPGDTDNQFQAPDQPGDGTIWIIVHDNRGGASWATVPVHVK